MSQEPLRERRRRELREQLSDAATRMFLDQGFDAVRVADVARACGVTEKTVFNHFRTKESLLVDRWEAQTAGLCDRLADPAVSPVDAALETLGQELGFLTTSAARREGAVREFRRFGELIRSTPALVAHNREALDRLTAAAATALADRAGTTADDPEPWIVASAIAGLWVVHARSLYRHLATGDAAEVVRAVRGELERAADTLRRGL